MDRGSDIIKILCGVFEDNHTPFSRAEFWKLYHKNNDLVEKILECGDERVEKLVGRSGSSAFSEEKLQDMGIKIVTFLDEDFPNRLYQKLGDFCPPIFYMCGSSNLLKYRSSGYVGSRTIEERDIQWTRQAVLKNLSDGFGIVSGGAKGVDSVAMECALDNGGVVITYLADNISSKIKDKYCRDHVMNGRLLMLSHVSPFAPKARHTFVAAAMERNKFIYAQSAGTVVVRSDLNKGGTWSGATETLRHKWAPVFVWANKEYAGNLKLIEMGAIPLSDNGKIVRSLDGDTKKVGSVNDDGRVAEDKTEYKQLSLFSDIEKLALV